MMEGHEISRVPVHERDKAGQQSLLSAMNKFVAAVNEMDDTVMIPSRLRDMPAQAEGSNTTLVPKKNNIIIQPDGLYGFYTMLNAVRGELVRGPCCERDDDENENAHVDEQSRHVAASFRHHLTGLFEVLRQLTDTAQYLTSRYKEEVGDCITTTKVSPL